MLYRMLIIGCCIIGIGYPVGQAESPVPVWQDQESDDGSGFWLDGIWVDLSPEEEDLGYWEEGTWKTHDANPPGSGYFAPD